MSSSNADAFPIQISSYPEISRHGEQFVSAHTLMLVISGHLKMAVFNKSSSLQAGDICFIQKNTLFKAVKMPFDGEACKTISISIRQDVLENYAKEYPYEDVAPIQDFGIQILPANQLLRALMDSFIQSEQTFRQAEAAALLQMKIKEAILTLLMAAPALKNILFDFKQRPRIAIKGFMLKNYHYNLNLPEFAELTGRSLSTFKRDFEHSFQTSPSKWLVNKRLEEAYYLIRNKKKKVLDIYLDLGFEDLSHFSYAFKNKYGIAPSML